MAYHSKFQSDEIDALFAVVLSLQNQEDCYRFFEDLLTITELGSIAQRWQVAKDLDAGVTYAEIARLRNASSATISRVSRCLEYGSNGYRMMLDREKARVCDHSCGNAHTAQQRNQRKGKLDTKSVPSFGDEAPLLTNKADKTKQDTEERHGD